MRHSFRARRRKKSVSFNPSSDFVTDAIKDFQNQGGKIKIIDGVNDYFDEFIALREKTPPADDFLFDR